LDWACKAHDNLQDGKKRAEGDYVSGRYFLCFGFTDVVHTKIKKLFRPSTKSIFRLLAPFQIIGDWKTATDL
jgi:hypothetical protein